MSLHIHAIISMFVHINMDIHQNDKQRNKCINKEMNKYTSNKHIKLNQEIGIQIYMCTYISM